MKVGILLVCTGELYWPYAKQLIDDARVNLLKDHEVDYLLWTDMSESSSDDLKRSVYQAYLNACLGRASNDAEAEAIKQGAINHAEVAAQAVDLVNTATDIKKFAVEHTQWPYPTLMRYHLFMGEEEALQKYDYLFYIDVDMRIVAPVGDEVMGDGLTATVFPMFTAKPGFEYAPFDTNPVSAAYVDPQDFWDNHEPKFYFAGGFQGGTKASFIEAMNGMKEQINKDFAINYLARWNDESHWNKYLYTHAPNVILDHSYVYPDSMIENYYKPLWGRDYPPKIITLTKPFTISKEGGKAAAVMMERIANA